MDEADGAGTEDEGGEPAEPPRVAALRGAGVQVDTARLGHVAAVLGLVVIMAVAAVLLAAGIRKNSQIDSLKAHGVPVQLTVTRCLALIGGTGSSPAGFECKGTYVYRGYRYTEGIPGSDNLAVGSTLHGIVASDDPGLFSTPRTLASERPSAAKVVVPAVALAACAGLLIWVVVRRRRRTSPS